VLYLLWLLVLAFCHHSLLIRNGVNKLTGEGSTNRAILAEHTRSAARLLSTRGSLRVDQNIHCKLFRASHCLLCVLMQTISLIHGIGGAIGAFVHGFCAVVSVHVALGLGIKEPRCVCMRFRNVGSHMKGSFAVSSCGCKIGKIDMQDQCYLQLMHDYLSSSSVGHLLHVITSNNARNCVMDLAMDSVASQCPWQDRLRTLYIATRCFYFFAGCNRKNRTADVQER
jgi:hypothetical protein